MGSIKDTMKQVHEMYDRFVVAADRAEAEAQKMRETREQVTAAVSNLGQLDWNIRRAYEQLDKAINSEAQNFSRWAFFKMGVLAGCVGAGAGVLFFLLTVLGLRETLEMLGLR